MDEKKQLYIKSYVLYFLAVIAMIVVVVRICFIQYGDIVPDANVIDESGNEITTKIDSIEPSRGRILADDYSDLVTSVPLYNLYIDLTVMDDELSQEIDSLSYHLSLLFTEKSKSEWESELIMGRQNNDRYHKIATKVKYDIVKQVRTFPILREKKYKGGYIEEKYIKREMPYGELAQRTLGYKREGAKPVGLEGAFDYYLTGEYGLENKQLINGSWKPVGSEFLKDPVDGADIVTSINIDIQDVAENELRNQLENQSAKHGSVVLMEVETGFVKAIANLTRGEDGKYYESYNHAVANRTDPGSTFKLVSLMALLEDDKVNITDTVGAYGEYQFYNHTVKDHDEGGYGRITIQQAFEKSSNVFSKIVNDAYKKNPQEFINTIRSFGIADTLGIDISGEPFPMIKNVGQDGWSGLTLPQMAIGYEVELTPLQILAFYNAVANNGELIRPQFVKEIRKDGKTLKTYEKVVLNEKICSDETLEKLKICLEGVVERGTGSGLKSANFKIAGKTGTAKIANTNQGYGTEYLASFVGYFPADKPKYSCIVSIAGPTQQIYGAQVSGTVFAAIANKVFSSSMEYHPNYNGLNRIATYPSVKNGNADDAALVLEKLGVKYKNLSQNENWIVAGMAENYVTLEPRYVDKTHIPNLVGMPLNDAVFLCENAGLRVMISGSGRVVSQSLTAGDVFVKGQSIKLELR
ncbi:MAG: transpeptidase family protein [Crocinitomicaceae bacterium]|nr:transpeptidase family protein [Crocinitomicaceae bacterium]